MSSTISTLPLPEFSLWNDADERMLFSFELELTARCNNNCRHCYINLPAGDRTARRKELSTDELMGLSRDAARLGALWCLLTGGEPLLRPDFREIYLGLKKMGLLVSVFTNATLIQREHVALFQKYPPRTLEISLYGATKETYEAVTRVPGSYDACMRGVDMLLKGGIGINLKTVALRSNRKELPRIADICRRYSRDSYRFDPLLHLRLDRDEKRNRDIISERLTPREIAEVERADSERSIQLRETCRALPEKNHTPGGSPRLFGCGAGQNDCTIGWDGYLRLCNALYHPDCIYDLRSGTLADAWEHFIPAVRAMKVAGNCDNYCGNCRLVNLCLWCPAHAYLEAGDMQGAVGYFCAVAKERERAVNSKQ